MLPPKASAFTWWPPWVTGSSPLEAMSADAARAVETPSSAGKYAILSGKRLLVQGWC